ncbi:MAG: MMPL family transporter [bacterium]
MTSQARYKAALVVLVLLSSVAVIAFQFKISTDLKLFLPEPSSKEERLLHHQLDNGASTDLIFIALSGLSPEQLAASNKTLTEALSKLPLFRKVVNRASELSTEGLEFVVDNRYLLSHRSLAEEFTIEGFERALEERIRGLSSPQSSIEKKYLRQDPSGEVIALLEDWQGKLSKHSKPEELHGIWFSQDHSRTLILAEMESDVTRLENQVESVEAIRGAFSALQEPGLEITLTGPAAFAVETGQDIRDDVRMLTWMAVLFVTVFLWLVYRSFSMLLLVFSPLLTGVAVATAGILLMHGQIHGITLAFGVTLAGVAVDYPIHLLTGLTRKRGRDLGYVDKIWPTLRLGVFSTIIAYAAFLLSGFGGLQQLGVFTIIGLSTAALFSRWVLPILLHSDTERRQGLKFVHTFLTTLANKVSAVRPMVLIAGVLGLFALTITDLPILHLNVDSLSPIKDSRRAEGKMLREDLGYWYGGRMLIISAESKERVLQRSEEIEPYLDELILKGSLSGYDMVSQFLPSMRKQQRNLTAIQDLNSIQNNLNVALESSRFKPGVFEPFLSSIKHRANTGLLNIDELMKQDLGRRFQSLIFDFEEGSAGVVLLHGVTDEKLVRDFADEHAQVIFMHLKTSATKLVARSVDRVSLIMIGCVLLIYLLLTVTFRSPWRPLKIMVPTFSAAIVTATLLVLFDCPLSIFHLISLLLVVGLGLDYALFFNRLPGNADEWNTTFKSLWVCGFTTILVFGILVLSQTPPLKAIGMTVGIGASLSILFAAMWATAGEKREAH